MDESAKQLCEKVCVEYCENGYVSEPVYENFIENHNKLNYPDLEQANTYMRNFIQQYIKDNNLPWRNNCYLYGEAYGFKIFTEINELPKEVQIFSVS